MSGCDSRDARILRVERRTFLVLGAAAVGLGGCTRGPVEPAPSSAPASPTQPEDPDAGLREGVAASEVVLIAAYRSAIQADPELAADLEPVLAHHEQHLARIAPGVDASQVSPSTASPSAPTSAAESDVPLGSESPSPNTSPGPSIGKVLAQLAELESAAQAQRATACDRAWAPTLARDLCLVAASEAQHAATLAGLAARESES